MLDQLLEQRREGRVPGQRHQATQVLAIIDLLAQHIQEQQVAQALQQGGGWCGVAPALLENQLEQGPGRGERWIAGAQHDPAGQALDDQRRQPGLEVEETAHQSDPILGAQVQGGHGQAWQLLRLGGLLRAGQPVVQVLQQEHRITSFQALRLGQPVDMQPAVPLHDQVETGPGQALGTGMPAAAVASDVEQAGVQLQAF